MKHPLTGILPVAPTPFHDDGSVDTEGMTRVLDCMIDQGVDAICILANYSEQFVLSDAERATLTKVSLEHAAGRVPVIVTVSHFSTQVVVDRAREAEAMGAAMLMMMPPYHGVGLVPAEAGIFEHFAAVSDAISIPIMVQDAPLSGVSLPVPLLVRMAKEIENVSYFKMETPFAADKLAALIEAGGDHIVGPFDGEEAVTLLADLDAGCTRHDDLGASARADQADRHELPCGRYRRGPGAVARLSAADQSREPPMWSAGRQGGDEGRGCDRFGSCATPAQTDVGSYPRKVAANGN